jgi:hypothetical protein
MGVVRMQGAVDARGWRKLRRDRRRRRREDEEEEEAGGGRRVRRYP